MQRDRVAQKMRDAVESAIVELHAEREKIDEELSFLIAMLKAGTPKQRKSRVKGKSHKVRPKAKRNAPGRNTRVALHMVSGGKELTAPLLAKAAGISTTYASNILVDLWRAHKVQRLRRGVYGRKA